MQTNLNSLAVTKSCHCRLAKRRPWVLPEDRLHHRDHRLNSGLDQDRVPLWSYGLNRRLRIGAVRASCQSTLPHSPWARKPMRSVAQTQTEELKPGGFTGCPQDEKDNELKMAPGVPDLCFSLFSNAVTSLLQIPLLPPIC